MRNVDKQEDAAIIKMLEELTGKTLTPLQREWVLRVSEGGTVKLRGCSRFDSDHKSVPPEVWENRVDPFIMDSLRQALK